jgi:hypothetical protein
VRDVSGGRDPSTSGAPVGGDDEAGVEGVRVQQHSSIAEAMQAQAVRTVASPAARRRKLPMKRVSFLAPQCTGPI